MFEQPCSLNLILLFSTLLFETATAQSSINNTGEEMPPAITAASPKLMYYRTDEADTKLLECAAVGSPEPTYQWYKNGMIQDLNQPNIRPQGKGNILINPLTVADAGLYQCIATNTWGSTATNVTSLQWASLSVFAHGGIATQMVNQGSPCSLVCKPPISVPAASYTWVKSNGLDDQYPAPVTLDGRVQIDPQTGNLHFANVIPGDSTTGNILYKCNAYNPYLQRSTGGSFNMLTVKSVSDPQTTGPTVAFWSSTPTIAVAGKSARIACSFYGYPTPTVTWRRRNGGLPEGRYTLSNANTVLNIDPVDLPDQGVYECTGQNSVNSQTITIQLYVQAEPTFISGPVNINATDGQNVSFCCNATGNPTPTIMWYQNLRTLNPFKLPEKFSLSPDLRILTITNICRQCANGQSDLQVIQCNASNAQGYAYGSGYLNVIQSLDAETDDSDEPMPTWIIPAFTLVLVVILLIGSVKTARFCRVRSRRRQTSKQMGKPKAKEMSLPHQEQISDTYDVIHDLPDELTFVQSTPQTVDDSDNYERPYLGKRKSIDSSTYDALSSALHVDDVGAEPYLSLLVDDDVAEYVEK